MRLFDLSIAIINLFVLDTHSSSDRDWLRPGERDSPAIKIRKSEGALRHQDLTN